MKIMFKLKKMFHQIFENFSKIIKVIFFNVLFFFFIIFVLELIFGYWFDKDNLGPYVREHRLRKNTYIVTYEDKKYEFIYKRNYYGFRGEEIELNKINAVIVGGSTTDERYKPEELTITELTNKKLRYLNTEIKLINAGIEGQSTRGHLANLKFWFPKLKDFNPKYIVFYVGINDQFVKDSNTNQFDGHVLEPNTTQRFYDNIKSRSIVYDEIRKIKHKYYSSEKKLSYNFDEGIKEYKQNKKNFLNYNDYLKKNNIDYLLKDKSEQIDSYLARIDALYNETVRLNSIPIFINQVTSDGFNNELLSKMNIFLINHCIKNQYYCIDLASELEGDYSFWWDGIHTTPLGSEAISNILAPRLVEIFNKN